MPDTRCDRCQQQVHSRLRLGAGGGPGHHSQETCVYSQGGLPGGGSSVGGQASLGQLQHCPPHSAQLAPRSTLTTPGVCCPPLCPPWLSGARPVGPQHADLGPILWLSSRFLYQLCPWPRAPGVHTQGPWAEGLHTQVLTAPCQSHCPHYTVTPGPRTGCWVEALSLKVTCWKSARPLPNLL